MKLLFLLTGLLVSPLMSTSQSISTTEEKNPQQKNILLNSDAQLMSARFYVAKEYVVKINYKKSRDLTSIKAFRKATQLRAKRTIKC